MCNICHIAGFHLITAEINEFYVNRISSNPKTLRKMGEIMNAPQNIYMHYHVHYKEI